MTVDLRQRMLDAAPLHGGSSREPLRLDDADALWWVEEGGVNVFAVSAKDGQPLGAREYLYRVKQGGLLVGMDPAALGDQWTMVGVLNPGTRLRRLSWPTLMEWGAEPDLSERVAALVAGWVAALTDGARKGIQPKHYLPFKSGETLEPADGQAFFSAERLVFVKLMRGEATLLSVSEPRVTAQSAILPLPHDAWMHAAQGCQVEAMSPTAALGQPDFCVGLQTYHAHLVNVSLRVFEATARGEAERMKVKAGHARDHLAAGLSAFARTLRSASEESFDELAADPLLASCQLIGQRMQVQFVVPPSSGAENADPVEELANAARVRYRQVALRGNWWLADGGHLLGRLQDSKQPVALLRTPRGYELHDPVQRTVQPVDETVAATLVPFAQSFFKSLPSRPLVFKDLARFAFHSAAGDWRALLVLGPLIGVLTMLTPVVMGYMFDTLIPASERSQVMQFTGALMVVAIASGMFSLARSMTMVRMESRMDEGLQAAIWDRALNLPILFFRGFSSGELADRLNAISAIRAALSGNTLGSLLAGFFSLINIALLLYYNLTLGALAVGLVLGAALLTVGMGLIKLRYDRQVIAASGRLSGLVLEYLRGVTKLRVTGAESRAFANWAAEFARMRKLAFGSGNVSNVNEVFFSLYQVVVDILIFATTAWLLTQAMSLPDPRQAGALPVAAMSTGQFIAFYGAFGQVMGAVIGLSATLLAVLNLVPQYERIKPILEAELETDVGKSHPGELQGQINVANLTFRYDADGPPVLDDVSFAVPPGGYVAVVGPSGSGKSTLLRCLLGFEQPSAGGVFYDNQNLADLDARAVRQQMGVVLQHSQVMPGDIFSNIVGTTRLTIEDAWAAARFCGLEDDINAMPMAMHTVISEGGNTLSGGQRQRILIARAIVQRPRLLLFDEATSALDNPTQEIVTRSLNELRATRVVIAHRLTTIMNAHTILVMDKGRIAQSGTYAELMAGSGLFRDLAKRQLV